MSKFAVLILTHGRADRVNTYKALRRGGYSGKIYLVVDDGDKSLPEYRERYKKELIIFNKEEIAKGTDAGDNFGKKNSVLFARNACFGIAKDLGLDYFLELDDDYGTFLYKFTENNDYKENRILSLDAIFSEVIRFLESSVALSVAFAQNGDFIGGGNGSFGKKIGLRRKCMNSFFCSTKREFKFVGIMNDDVNTYVSLGNRGNLFFTIGQLSLIQKQTQSNKGGLSDIYSDMGTYVKSFYTVMMAPSCVSVSMMGEKHSRLHHRISWRNAVPVILSEDVKKPAKL